MLPAVQFDNQPPLNTREIDNVRSDRMLPAKFLIGDIPATQPKP
jgi:hypothetical protein